MESISNYYVIIPDIELRTLKLRKLRTFETAQKKEFGLWKCASVYRSRSHSKFFVFTSVFIPKVSPLLLMNL